MRIINTSVCAFQNKVLVIGFEGENERTQVRIDASEVFTEYPHATPSLTVKPNSGEAYPATVNRDGTDVVWDITSSYLTERGECEIQLTFIKDSVVCKSYIGKALVLRSLTVEGEMPTPVESWVDAANAKLAEVDAQITELEGMVDTATDAATRAEQSEDNATTSAANAATSAATASTKAAEAQASANTATAKASEAALSATQARNSAMSAANSESGATAKAAEAAQSAQTAAQKAEQITEAAQIASGKAEEASASATAAHASATDAASSATAASASETAAKASETAASTSATQAAQSVLDAGANAQTAMQKATEATQSATNAAASATSAATSAETASTKAGEAAQSAQAVAETAEQLADSLEQIGQNTQDIAELDERKANIDGYYPDMTVGNAEQLNSSKFVENSEPYTFRTSGGSADIGNREYLDAVVGGTLAWNQAVRDSASENSTDFAPIVTVTDAVEDAAGVKVKIEPVQDLHGYDNPWPAGGGKNLIVPLDRSFTNNGVPYVCSASAETVSLKGTATNNGGRTGKLTKDIVLPAGTYTLSITAVSGTRQATYIVNRTDNNAYISTASFSLGEETSVYVGANVLGGTVYDEVVHIQIEAGSTSTAWTPYSNICPITGWDGVKVTRTGKNLYSGTDIEVSGDIYYTNALITMKEAFKKLKPGRTYICSAVFYARTGSAADITFVFSDGQPSFSILRAQKRLSTDRQSTTFTIPANVNFDNLRYVLVYGGAPDNQTTAYVKDIQIEPGSTATDYEPYAGNTYDITLPTEAGTVYGGELTVNADGSGSLVVDSINYDVSNDTSWGTATTTLGGTYFYKTFTDTAIMPLYTAQEIALSKINEKYSCGRIENPYDHAEICAWVYRASDGGYLRIGFSDEMGIDTIEKFNEWRANNTVQIYYPLLNPTTYTLTPTEIRTLLGENNVWADTGDVALTYTGTDEHLTLESGKKYLARISGTDSMLLGSGQEITAVKGTDNVFDLTKMFGTAVADYVYGQGASFFRRWFPNARYPYNAGELRHVEGLQSHDMVGFNQWDEEWELGTIRQQDGAFVNDNTRIRSKNYNPCVPNAVYYVEDPTNGNNIAIRWYDADKNFVSASGWLGNTTIQAPENAYYFAFVMASSYGTTYKHDICISLAHNGSRNGEYAPYEKHSYPLDSLVILRGIPKVDANGVYWDGDRYLSDGTVERRYMELVLTGGEMWKLQSVNSHGIANFLYDLPANSGNDRNSVCDKFNAQTSAIAGTTTEGYMISANQYLYIRIFATTANTVEQFKTWLSNNPITLVYELATPTTETAQPYHSTQWVSDWGTEEFVSTSIVPVGTETRYPANLRDKLQHLPDAASGNGSYLITQTDGQMVLTPFPAPPSTAGNYVLKATVTNGVATYTWEAAT